MTRKFVDRARARELSRFAARSSSRAKTAPRTDLVANYGGQWVALRNGAVIDHDVAVGKLLARLDAAGAATEGYTLDLVPRPGTIYVLSA